MDLPWKCIHTPPRMSGINKEPQRNSRAASNPLFSVYCCGSDPGLVLRKSNLKIIGGATAFWRTAHVQGRDGTFPAQIWRSLPSLGVTRHTPSSSPALVCVYACPGFHIAGGKSVDKSFYFILEQLLLKLNSGNSVSTWTTNVMALMGSGNSIFCVKFI